MAPVGRMLFIGKFQMSFDPEGAFPGIHPHFVTGLDFWGRVLMTSSVNLPLILPRAGLVSHSHTAQRSDPEVGPAAHLPFAKKEHPLRSPDLGC